MNAGKKFTKALRLFNNNNFAECRKSLKAIIYFDRRNIDAWMLLGMTEARCNDFCRAAACFRSILSFSPDSIDAHYYLGAALEAQFDYAGAITEYLATIHRQPKYVKAYYNLGNIYRKQGLLEKAEYYYRSALKETPDFFEALNNLGSVLKTQSKLEAAIDAFNTALKIRPDDASVLTNLGNTYHLLENYDEAKKYYRQALVVDNSLVEAIIGLGGVLYKNGEGSEAFKLLADAKRRVPDNDVLIASEAELYENSGLYDLAYETIRQRIDVEAGSVDIAASFAQLSHHIGFKERAADGLLKCLNRQLDASERMRINFILAKLYDSMGMYEQAFDCIARGNSLKPLRIDRNDLNKKFENIISIFSRDLMSSAPRSGNSSTRPVFVIGMPRSGTSLVEQILSSHPDIHGAGELMDIGMIVASMQQTTWSTEGYPQCVTNITEEVLNKFSEAYVGRIEKLAPTAKRVVDKMPGNFMHLGLIELLFPNASVIHCVRNPLDNCLSCYFTDFSGYHPYSYNQSNLGYYYCQYLRLMGHWEHVISLSRYTVQYEVLVNNQQQISRELVEFCGLDWDERCLAFHKNKRLVKTASYDQVRKPIYKSSIRRSDNYREKLHDLIEELKKCGCFDSLH